MPIPFNRKRLLYHVPCLICYQHSLVHISSSVSHLSPLGAISPAVSLVRVQRETLTLFPNLRHVEIRLP